MPKRLISGMVALLLVLGISMLVLNMRLVQANGVVGDVDDDGDVDMEDLLLAAQAFGSTPSNLRWNANADINGDSKVDIKDLCIIAKNLNL